jgi:hypothetical protein
LVVFGGIFVGFNLLVKAPLWFSHEKCPAFTVDRHHKMAGIDIQAAQTIRKGLPASLIYGAQPINVDASAGIIVARTSAAKLDAKQQGAFRSALRAGTLLIAKQKNAPSCYTWAVVSESGAPLLLEQYDARTFGTT